MIRIQPFYLYNSIIQDLIIHTYVYTFRKDNVISTDPGFGGWGAQDFSPRMGSKSAVPTYDFAINQPNFPVNEDRFIIGLFERI